MNKKYRLLKDLPWLKAGTIVWIERDVLRTEKEILAAECYEATMNYFFVDEDGEYDPNANPSETEWFEPLTDEQEQIEELDYLDQNWGKGLKPEFRMAAKINELVRAVNSLTDQERNT